MPQLQGLAAVTSLVVSYNSCAVIYQELIEASSDRWNDQNNQALDKSFISGGSEIQYEYEAHFARLGPRFSSADGNHLAACFLLSLIIEKLLPSLD